MKRRQTEDEIIFYRLPLEVLNKMQSMLKVASFINLGRTCKELHETQITYMKFREEEIYTRCLARIKSYLEELELLKLLEGFLPLFESNIRGPLVSQYLHNVLVTNVALIKLVIIQMPYHIDLLKVCDYFKKNMDFGKYIFTYNTIIGEIWIFNKETTRELLVQIQRVKVYGKQKFISRCLCTDLKKIYCQNLWQLLKRKEEEE